LKEIHFNRCPVLVEWGHLREADFQRLAIDPLLVEGRVQRLRQAGPALAEKLRQVYARRGEFEPGDVDASIYDGFIPDGDKRKFPQVRSTPPHLLAHSNFAFRDPRLQELLFRYRARNWPQTLAFDEHERWNDYRRRRLSADNGLSELTFEQARAEIAALREAHGGDGARLALLDQLEAWNGDIEASLS
jgi:exodeoxyribonuclease-1